MSWFMPCARVADSADSAGTLTPSPRAGFVSCGSSVMKAPCGEFACSQASSCSSVTVICSWLDVLYLTKASSHCTVK
jgi:hypothetical protein